MPYLPRYFSQFRFFVILALCLYSTFGFGESNQCRSIFGSETIITENPALGFLKTPSTNLLGFYRNLIFEMKRENQFPSVSASKLKIEATLNVGGRGNKEILLAKYRNQDVVIKVSDPSMRDENMVFNEARWLMFLNKFGIGPEFFGLHRTNDGDLALIMSYVEGEAVSKNFRQLKTKIEDSMLTDIYRTGVILKQLGVNYAPDIQFILTPKGRAILIDVEFFQWNIPIKPPLDPRIMPYDPAQNADSLVQRLRQEKTNGRP